MSLGVAAAVVLLGAALDAGYQQLTPAAVRTDATVVDFVRDHSRSSQPFPVFEFADASGRIHRVVNPRSQTLARFEVGDRVPVAYSERDPDRARIDTLWLSHGRLLAALGGAVALVLAGLARGRGSGG